MKKAFLALTAPALALLVFLSCNSGSEKPQQKEDTTAKVLEVPTKVTFPSLDKLTVTANLYYSADNKKGFIVYCHMAAFNKSEYRTIARKLFDEGYNGLAVDLRSGDATSGYDNETRLEADKKGKETGFLDAEQDMIAAVNYIYKEYNTPVILWGSSYSASLALKVGKNNDHVKAILAFSPGEYFEADSLSIKTQIRDVNKPMFITSSREEVADGLIKIIDVVGPSYVTHYRPKGKGEHGSMCLWQDSPDQLEYWKAVDAFLEGLK